MRKHLSFCLCNFNFKWIEKFKHFECDRAVNRGSRIRQQQRAQNWKIFRGAKERFLKHILKDSCAPFADNSTDKTITLWKSLWPTSGWIFSCFDCFFEPVRQNRFWRSGRKTSSLSFDEPKNIAIWSCQTCMHPRLNLTLPLNFKIVSSWFQWNWTSKKSRS